MSEQNLQMHEVQDEPDLTHGRPNPYAEKMKHGSNLVLIEPDVFEAFPSSEAVNDALRLLIKTAASVSKKLPHAS